MYKKIRIIHFELDKNLGGIETFLLNLYKQIDKEEVQFEFIVPVEKAALEEEFYEIGGVIHHVASHKDLFNYCKDIKRILSTGVDVVHIHKNSAANIIPLFLCKQNRVKKIFVHSHNTSPSTSRFFSLLHRVNKPYLNKVANKKFACSTEAGKWLFNDNTFEIITNGIITDNFRFDTNKRAKKRKELAIDSNTIVIGNIGRFTKQKNQIRIVDIFESIHKLNRDTKLLLIGEGELQKDVKDYVVSRKLTNEVLFLGLRHDIPELLMVMDAFLMPSIYEGLPIVAIEAQAAGLPIFLSNTISSETEITHAIKWFSLESSNEEIANIIYKEIRENTVNRVELLNQVVKRGYDMKSTANKMLSYYLE